MEGNLLATVIQGGAVGIAIFALIIILKIVREHRKDMRDVLKDNTDAHLKVAEALGGIAASIGSACKFERKN